MFSALLLPAQPAPMPSMEAYVEFAMRTDGNAARGREVFASERKAACAKCHTADGSSGRAGPDLFAIGDKFPRRELIRSLLEPSSTIAVGYGTTLIETRSGDDYQGVVKQATGAWIELMDAAGALRRIQTSDIQSQRIGTTSLMPEGLHAGMTLQEFSDLVAWLETLRQAANPGTQVRGMPEVIAPAARGVTFDPFFGANIRLNHPVWFGEVPGRTNAYVVLEHFGKSWLIERTPSGDVQTGFLDLSGVVRGSGATGLLGLAFHPKFALNRKYYLKYQVVEEGRISTVLVERRFTADLLADSGEPARQLLKIPSTTQDHNGGCIGFGPDGFLYVGMGDTGPQRDPQGHGQDLGILLGKILRIDVDRGENGLPYGIPAGNPFRGQAGTRPEIWAYGFREPWRFSFDAGTGDLWVGDVGQDRIEEVAVVRAGENHGWNVYEGFDRFSDRHRRDGARHTPPVFAYAHSKGVSITGGHVYRGSRAPALRGWYVCADFESRRVWALTQTNGVLDQIVEIGRAPARAVSFTQLGDGELCLVGYDSGVIFRLGLDRVDTTPLETRVIADTAEKSPVRWRHTTTRPAGDWQSPQFDDAAWTNAPGGFGSAGTPGAIVRTEWRARDIWLRREFVLPEKGLPDATRPLMLRLHHDEDAEVFLNGIEIARLPRWTSGYIDMPVPPEAARSLRPGRNVLAIHCRQNTGGQYIDAGLIQFAEKRR